MHVHDLVPFPTKDFDFSHTIHKLTFGEGYPGMKNPLDGVTINQQGPRNPTGRPGMFQAFLRVRQAFNFVCWWNSRSPSSAAFAAPMRAIKPYPPNRGNIEYACICMHGVI